MFAKIFESGTYGQLCVIASSENSDGEPEVRVFARHSSLGVCSSSLLFPDTKDGLNDQEKTFSKVNLAFAEAMAAAIFEAAGIITKEPKCQS
jgi:hypothetical protein